MFDFNHAITQRYIAHNGNYLIGGQSNSKTSLIEAIASQRPRGGTYFDEAISQGLSSIGKNADLIFITDAEDIIDPTTKLKIIKAKEDGLRIFTIAIGACVSWLEELSDVYIDIVQVSSEDIEKAIGGIMLEAKSA